MFIVKPSDNKEVISAIKMAGINTEYKPRFAVFYGDKVIGGSTFDFFAGAYLFDIGILEEYQGMGIAKELMQSIVEDAKKMGAARISTYVVNERFGNYLSKIGFSVYGEEATMHTYVNSDDMKYCVESEKESEGLECDSNYLKNYIKRKKPISLKLI